MLIERKYIDKAKEILGDKMAYIIAEELGLSEQLDEKNLKMCCPFHDENTPSFIWNKKSLSFHCFGACGRNYDIIDVLMYKGKTYIEAVQRLFELADITYAFGEHRVQTKHQYKYPTPVDCSDKSKVYEYLESRRISHSTADYLDIRQDQHGNLVFNYYDTNDTLTMVKYRPSHKVQKGEAKNWCQPGADTFPLLFNMNRINVTQPLLICSGELDCAAAIESGWTNAVSIPLGDQNTHWVEENWDWLEQFDDVIICPDNDESGMKYCKDIVPRLGSWRCKVAVVPEDCKDINEVLFRHDKTAVMDMILHAQDSPVASVSDLSDIDDIDLDQIDGIYTGIAGLDSELMKIFYGTLTIVSGQPGSGKTSFLYQIICQALDQGKNCWLYSKELPEWMTKNWFNFILGGRRNVKEYSGDKGATYYKVPTDVKHEIDSYYRGKWFVYRDDCSNKLDDVIDSMTDVVRKFGVKLLVIDNLMTLDLDANEDNLLQRQTDAINRLIQFSMKYDVAVILVAHPRKLIGTSDVGMYDISGTSNIVNLAHRTIGLRRVTPSEKRGVLRRNGDGWETPPCKFDVMCTVIKDRIRGRANYVDGLYYDIPSRRFFSNPDEFNYQYKWDHRTYTEAIRYPIIDDESEVFGDG